MATPGTTGGAGERPHGQENGTPSALQQGSVSGRHCLWLSSSTSSLKKYCINPMLSVSPANLIPCDQMHIG